MKNTRRILIIIDAQFDFINGSLGVEGAEAKMIALANFIRNHYKEYDLIIMSADFHPITHCSFVKNGGIWPIHCMQHSHGAAIFTPILEAIEETGIDFQVLTKGLNEDREEYSVLKNAESNKKLSAIITANEVEIADFAGIAGDYCVKDSMADFHREFPQVKMAALIPFIASIDGGKALDEFLAKNDSITAVSDAA